MEKQILGNTYNDSAVNQFGDETIEASDMGWMFPPTMFTRNGEWWRIVKTEKYADGEIFYWQYQGVSTGNMLTVFND